MRISRAFASSALVLSVVVAARIAPAIAKDDDSKAVAEVATELGAYAKACLDVGGKTEAEIEGNELEVEVEATE